MKNLFLLSLLVTGGALAQPVTVVDVSNPSQPSNAQYSAPRSNQGRIIIEMQQHIDSLQQELNELRGILKLTIIVLIKCCNVSVNCIKK